MEIRRSYDRLISTMGFPILVRWHLYIESWPRLLQAVEYSPIKSSFYQSKCSIESISGQLFIKKTIPEAAFRRVMSHVCTNLPQTHTPWSETHFRGNLWAYDNKSCQNMCCSCVKDQIIILHRSGDNFTHTTTAYLSWHMHISNGTGWWKYKSKSK